MTVSYRIPPGAAPSRLHNRYLAATPQGGRVALDPALFALWQAAAGRELDAILAAYPAEEQEVARMGLACLVNAGLLIRVDVPSADVPRATYHVPGDDMSRADVPGERVSLESLAHKHVELEHVTPDNVTPENLAREHAVLISAVIVAYNGREWLERLLPSLLAQSYRPLEILVVDNASQDGSAGWLAQAYPQARVLRLDSPRSFAAATNLGVAQAAGEAFLLLNQDTWLEPDAVAHLAAALQAHPQAAAIAPKLRLAWTPGFLNGLGNRVGAFSWGMDNGLGRLDLGQFDDWRALPSACFAAALIPRAAWQRSGPLDEGFPMYYEDSEWCYRARLYGQSVQAAPQAVIYHAFSGRAGGEAGAGLSPRKLQNVVTGRLRFAALLLSPLRLARFLLTYGLEDLARAGIALLRLQPKKAAAVARGWRAFLASLPELRRTRRAHQSRRAISDAALFALQGEMPPTLAWRGLPELTWDLIRHDYLPLAHARKIKPMPELEALTTGSSSSRPRLLIISKDVVDAKMGGSGMRNLEMARALAPEIDVTLALPAAPGISLPGVRTAVYQEGRPETLQPLAEAAEVILLTGDLYERFPFLGEAQARLVIDFYAPIVLENLHYYTTESLAVQDSLNQPSVDITNRLARLGDFYICGSERQRDFWLGVLAANGRINPRNFAQDPSFRALIDVVAIGFPNRPPHGEPFLRGARPQIPPEARIVLWGGGIWEWLDPLSLVRAWPQVLARHPEARLVFLGTRHPNPNVPRHRMAAQTEALAAEIGEKDRTILFFEWLAYAEREALLKEADVGVTLHPPHIETHFSIRTRVLDYFWAGLPVLVSDGDVTSEWVRRYGLGQVAPPLDVDAVAQALIELLDHPKSEWAPAFSGLPEIFNWQKVVEPLRRYCLEGAPAGDRTLRQARLSGAGRTQSSRALLERAGYIWRKEGTRALLQRGWRYVQWRLSRP